LVMGQRSVRKVSLEAAKVERAWAVVSAHRDGMSIRKTAEPIGLSATRVHQLVASPDAAGWEARLDVLRTHGPGRHPRTHPMTPPRVTSLRSDLPPRKLSRRPSIKSMISGVSGCFDRGAS